MTMKRKLKRGKNDRTAMVGISSNWKRMESAAATQASSYNSRHRVSAARIRIIQEVKDSLDRSSKSNSRSLSVSLVSSSSRPEINLTSMIPKATRRTNSQNQGIT